jgi:hypothetical protein
MINIQNWFLSSAHKEQGAVYKIRAFNRQGRLSQNPDLPEAFIGYGAIEWERESGRLLDCAFITSYSTYDNKFFYPYVRMC